jgi:hypothetical protein
MRHKMLLVEEFQVVHTQAKVSLMELAHAPIGPGAPERLPTLRGRRGSAAGIAVAVAPGSEHVDLRARSARLCLLGVSAFG